MKKDGKVVNAIYDPEAKNKNTNSMIFTTN